MAAPRVFISYSHDSKEHKARVVNLAHRLRRDGFDAWIDCFSPPPIETWPRWIERQLVDAKWVLLLCTETYRRRFDLDEKPGHGRGVAYEAEIVRGALYNSPDTAYRFIPVTFSPEDNKHIPARLVSATHYCVSDFEDEAYAAL